MKHIKYYWIRYSRILKNIGKYWMILHKFEQYCIILNIIEYSWITLNSIEAIEKHWSYCIEKMNSIEAIKPMLSHIEPHGHISKQIPQTWWTRSGSWSWTRSWDQVQVLDQVLDLDPSPLLHLVLGWAWSGPVLGFALGHFWFVIVW